MTRSATKKFLVSAVLLPLIGLAGLSASESENLDFQLEPGWKLASSAKGAKHSSIAEYVREGDDINSWKELVTVQTWGKSSRQPSPDEMFKSLQATRDKECPGSTRWNVIAEDEHRAWMMRSYSLTFAAATVRLAGLPILVLTRDPIVAITCTFWSWILNLAVAEWLIRRRSDIGARSPLTQTAS